MGCSFSTGAQKVEAVLQRFDGVAPRQATDGSVAKVVGRCAPAGATLVSPISGRPCVYYKVVIKWYFLGDSEEAAGWRISEDLCETKAVDFFLTDDTGAQIRVNAADARWPEFWSGERSYGYKLDKDATARDEAISTQEVTRTNGSSADHAPRPILKKVSPLLEAFLQRHGGSCHVKEGNKKHTSNLLAEEATLEAGDVVEALGVVRNGALVEVSSDAISKDRMRAEAWPKPARAAWKALFAKTPAILLKDAGTQRVRLEVPEGAAPGGRLDAAFPDGRKLVAVVPDWARPATSSTRPPRSELNISLGRRGRRGN